MEFLGHAEPTTTAIYTHIAVRKPLEVHRATNPGAAPEDVKPVLELLEAPSRLEDDEDDG